MWSHTWWQHVDTIGVIKVWSHIDINSSCSWKWQKIVEENVACIQKWKECSSPAKLKGEKVAKGSEWRRFQTYIICGNVDNGQRMGTNIWKSATWWIRYMIVPEFWICWENDGMDTWHKCITSFAHSKKNIKKSWKWRLYSMHGGRNNSGDLGDPLADCKYRILIVPGIGWLGLMSEINNGQHVCLKNQQHTD